MKILTLEELLKQYDQLYTEAINENDDDDYDDGEAAYQLISLRDKINIVPECCENSVKYPVIFLDISDDGKPSWKAYSDLKRSRIENGLDHYQDWYNKYPVPKCCPYCGTALPKVKKKTKKELEGRSVNSNEDDYCSSCNDRNRHCLCLPPSLAYKIVK